MNAVRCFCVAALAAFCALSIVGVRAEENGTPRRRILCTTFPICQLVRNITAGSDSVTVDLMIPAVMGCPHDYALTPSDMEKITAADILVINGLGMEAFIGKPVERANPDIVIVDSSLGVDGVIELDEADHGDGRAHRHDGPNAHLFVSPALYARMAETIAGRLCILDPDGAALYAGNAVDYAGRLRRLAGEMADAVKGIANNRIVEPHEAFDYLARDLGLEITARLQPHGQEPSAARMLDALEDIRETNPAVIVVEPQYPARAGEALAAETGLPVITLDPAASGPDSAPLDYYETVMRANISVLRSALGGRSS